MKPVMRILKIYVLALVIAVSASCSTSNGSVSESTNPKEAIQSAFVKLSLAKFFTSTTRTDMGGVHGETEVNYTAPDKYWIKNQSQAKSEIIAIGSDNYQKADDGKWTKLPPEKTINLSEFRDRLLAQANLSISEVESLGPEDLNGKKSFKYKFKNGGDKPSTITIWIFAETGLPAKLITETDGDRPIVVTTSYDFENESPINLPKLD